MKLSTLEKLVAAMRDNANRTGVEDPNVEFYDDNKQEMRDALERSPFCNMEVSFGGRDTSQMIRDCRVVTSGDVAQRGDFAIPLKPV